MDELPAAGPHVIPIAMADEETAPPVLETFSGEPSEAVDFVEVEEGFLPKGPSDGRRSAGAREFYVTIEGGPKGPIKGESTRRGYENKLAGLAFAYQVTSPRDPASGLATGKRQHKPVRFTKSWGAASPQLLRALVENQTFPTVTFQFVRPGDDGVERTFETVTLKNVNVTDIKRYIGPGQRELEEIALTFQSIAIRNLLGKTEGEDAWSSPYASGEVAEAPFPSWHEHEEGDASYLGEEVVTDEALDGAHWLHTEEGAEELGFDADAP